MIILNLTQHSASADQIAVGVVDFSGAELAALRSALTFDALPGAQEIRVRAEFIAELAATVAAKTGARSAMIGGALWLMAPIAAALRARGIEPVFAFSVRETEEQVQSDGSVRKVAVFRHAGFVPALS
jgi:hypothetical protein